jgi:ATP-dependent RNA circularization protein (DNA/RNA ligase family)
MTETFHKFPHTPHLIWLGTGSPRDDKLMKPDEIAEFLNGDLIVEEKVDGANLGLSLGPDGRLRAQSRGNYLAPGRCHAQWSPLWPWLAERRAILEEGLQGGLMLFGEWCHARHTVPYDALPDWFLGFDIFEIPTGKFLTVDRRNDWLNPRGIIPVPEVAWGRFSQRQLLALLTRSKVGRAPMEGIYLRREQGAWLQSRAKVVSTAFKQQIQEHWTRRAVIPNKLLAVHPGAAAQNCRD